MRNRATCEHLINLLVLRNPKLLSAAESRIDWLTDVTNPKSGECMSQLAWDSSGLVDPAFLNLFDGDPSLEDLKDLVDGPVDNINFFLTLFMLPWSCDVI